MLPIFVFNLKQRVVWEGLAEQVTFLPLSVTYLLATRKHSHKVP
jgi:hypothetical protein